MSTVSAKNILLSQPKAGLVNESISSRMLTHTVTRDGNESVVKIEVPGVDPATIEVNCDNNTVHVICERGEVTIPFDPTVDISKIEADVTWGMLVIRIPLPVPPAARAIKVNIADTAKKVTHTKAPAKFTDGE